MKKVPIIIALLFCAISLVFIAVGIGTEISFQRNSVGMISTTGVIADLDRARDNMPTIFYHVDGYYGVYHGHISSSSFRINDKYPLLVDPADYTHVLDPQERMFSRFLCGFMGAVLGLAGGSFYIVMTKGERQLRRIRRLGLPTDGIVTQVYPKRSVTVNGHSPWVVKAECLHPLTREKLTLESPWLWKTRLQPGDRVEVLVDPKSSKGMVNVEDTAL